MFLACAPPHIQAPLSPSEASPSRQELVERTGPFIWRRSDGFVQMVVAWHGVSTGGLVGGCEEQKLCRRQISL